MPTKFIQKATAPIGQGFGASSIPPNVAAVYVDADTNVFGFNSDGTARNLIDGANDQAIAGAKTFTSSITPTTTDSAALGSATVMWSDLFLASGAVINFNNGDVTITHAANALAVAGGTAYTFDDMVEVADDKRLAVGTDSDGVVVLRSTTLNANTAVTSVLIGTPVTSALAADSIIFSNVTASGDFLLALNRGGNSEEYLFADGSAGTLALTAPLGNLDLKTVAHNKPVRLRSQTFTGTLSSSIIGFQSKPGAGANASADVIGGEISPRINDTFTGVNIIGLHVDTYLKGTTGNLSGSVRGMQIELVTDDAGTRTVTGDVVGLRFRAAWSGTITGDMVMIRGEVAETQTNSKQWEYFLELTGTNGLVWSDDYGTETSTAAGSIKVRVNDADRWIALYSGAPSA